MNKKQTNADEQEDLSSSFQEILTAKPHFLVRRSVFLCAGVLVILLAITYLIRYPRIVVTTGRICTLKKGDSVLVGRGYIPVSYLRQVRPGMEVMVKLDAYPFQEYGLLRGRLISVSQALSDSGYLVVCVLPGAVAEMSKKKIGYQEGMGGRMEIVVEDKRLIQKLF
jgi:hypothetical protein